MKLSKLISRCGCPDSRVEISDVTNGPWTCCETCGNAPCHFVIPSACDWRLPGGELLLPKGCLYLLKDCALGCTWSARFDSEDEPRYHVPDCIQSCSISLDGPSGCECVASTFKCVRIDAVIFEGETNEQTFSFYVGSPRPVPLLGSFCGENAEQCLLYQSCGEDTWNVTVNEQSQQIRLTHVTYECNGSPFEDRILLNANRFIDGDPLLCSGFGSNFEFVVNRDGCVLPIDTDEAVSCGATADEITLKITIVPLGPECEDFPACQDPLFPCHWGANWETESLTDEENICGGEVEIGYAKWRLSIADGTVTLQLVTREDEYIATYEADLVVCTTYATMIRTEVAPELEQYIPKRLCLIPQESEPVKCCDDAESQCNCNTPGVVCGNESNCDTSRVRLAVAGCDGNVAFNGWIDMVRYDAESWPPATLDDSLAYPGESCGAWWGTFSVSTECTAPYDGNIGLLFVCTDEGTWTGKAYCYNTETETFEYQGDLDITREDECSGPLLTFTLPELDCCCLGVVVDCCEEPIPATLSWEVTTTSPCIEGPLSGTFEYNENTGWTVLFDPVDCNILALYLDCVIIEGTPYFQVLLQIRDSIDVTSQYTALVATGDVQCSPFELSTVLTDSSEGAAICCAGETLTLTVTEAA